MIGAEPSSAAARPKACIISDPRQPSPPASPHASNVCGIPGTAIMAFTAELPPTTRPIGNKIDRPNKLACGTERNDHDHFRRKLKLARGTSRTKAGYAGPDSKSSTVASVRSRRRRATTQPLVPDPTTMKSASRCVNHLFLFLTITR